MLDHDDMIYITAEHFMDFNDKGSAKLYYFQYIDNRITALL